MAKEKSNQLVEMCTPAGLQWIPIDEVKRMEAKGWTKYEPKKKEAKKKTAKKKDE